MSDKKEKTQLAGKIVTSLAAGLALGAATVLLSDKKNQKKVAKKLDEVKSWGGKTAAEWKEGSKDLQKDSAEVVERIMDKKEEVFQKIDQEVKDLETKKKKVEEAN